MLRTVMVLLAISTFAIGVAGRAAAASVSPPTVTSVSPSSGSTAGGTDVTIDGTNLTSVSQVDFGPGNQAKDFTVNSDGEITVIDPGGSPGTVDVTVINPAGTSATSTADQFTYVTPPVPTVISVSPTSGPTYGGTDVTITGSGFTGATNVQFGAGSSAVTAQSWTVVNNTEISAISPAEPAGTVDIVVTTPGGTSATSSADQFTYVVTPAPTVATVTPSSGPTSGGTVVKITGSGFSGTDDLVIDFGVGSGGGNPASQWTVVDNNEILVTSPSSSPGTDNVTVTTPAGTSATSSDDEFTFVAPVLPVVSSVSPNIGVAAGGTTVTISGTDLTGASAVYFGANEAPSTFTVNADGTITAVSPAGTGTVDVTVKTSLGTSLTSPEDLFTYYTPPPRPIVISITPDSGPTAGQTSVLIYGSNLNGVTSVDFGTGSAITFTIDTSTEITAISPPESAGTVDVTVTGPGGTSATSEADEFIFQAPPVLPTVTGLNPINGGTAGGTTVTITGTGFEGVTDVDFGTDNPAGHVVIDNDTEMTVTSPPGAAGTVNVIVYTEYGISSNSPADEFTYLSATGGGGGGGSGGGGTTTVHGYWLVAGDGGIFTFGKANFFGSTGNLHLQRPVVGMTPTADRNGYWLVATDGGMFAFGDAKFHGSIPGLGLAPAGSGAAKELAAPIVAMVASPNGQGYLLVASDGGVFAFGNALFHGSCPGIGGCSGSVVAVVPDSGELGYWVVTSTGHVYPFGNAPSLGQPNGAPAPITGAVASATGNGYLLVDARGDVYTYGDAQNYGGSPSGVSVPSTEIVGIVADSAGNGYWLMGSKGAVYAYGDAPNDGSMAGKPLNAPIVTAAGF